MSCCPPLRAHSPCSSTRPVSPARTLCCSDGVLFLCTAKICNCRLCFARRWDLRRQIESFWWTTPSPCESYAPAPTASRRWTCCPLRLYESICRVEATTGVSRACARRGTTVSPSPCHGLVMCTRICQLPRFFFGPTGIFIYTLFYFFASASGAFSYFFPVPRDISQNFPFPIA